MDKLLQCKMRKETWYQLLVAVLSVCICLLSYRLYVLTAQKISSAAFLQVNAGDTAPISADEAPMYYVFSYDGAVTVKDCRDGQRSILLKNIDPRTMRNGDRERFESGFFLYSEDEFRQLLEDYGS